ncbi:hypothetical protein ACJMK2_043335 [Sinanodonta woodiana]|uniref:Uncharacterized protein n=1 Tax=Sinanodonta woodiana TaxID=1069815 RepID=A0ABD3VWK5_SINWO
MALYLQINTIKPQGTGVKKKKGSIHTEITFRFNDSTSSGSDQETFKERKVLLNNKIIAYLQNAVHMDTESETDISQGETSRKFHNTNRMKEDTNLNSNFYEQERKRKKHNKRHK